MYFSNNSRIFPGHFPVFLFFWDFYRPGNLVFHFPGFQGFPGVWKPWFREFLAVNHCFRIIDEEIFIPVRLPIKDTAPSLKF